MNAIPLSHSENISCSESTYTYQSNGFNLVRALVGLALGRRCTRRGRKHLRIAAIALLRFVEDLISRHSSKIGWLRHIEGASLRENRHPAVHLQGVVDLLDSADDLVRKETLKQLEDGRVCGVRVELPRAAPSERPKAAVEVTTDIVRLYIDVDRPLFSAFDLEWVANHTRRDEQPADPAAMPRCDRCGR
jgi:hypothetical protein